jgi:hypothetical protein
MWWILAYFVCGYAAMLWFLWYQGADVTVAGLLAGVPMLVLVWPVIIFVVFLQWLWTKEFWDRVVLRGRREP